VLLAFLPVLAGLSVDAVQSRRHSLEAASLSARDDAILAVNAQAMYLSAISEMLAVAAASHDSVAHPANACPAYLRQLAQRQNGFANVGLLDSRGRMVCSAIEGGAGTDFSTRDYFREARDRGRFTVSSLLTGGLSGKRSLVFAYPRHASDGSFAGVIFVSFADSEFARLRFSGKKDVDSHFAYFDRNGELIAHDPLDSKRSAASLDAASMEQAARHPGEALPNDFQGADGARYISALAAIPGPSGPVAYVRSILSEDTELQAWRAGVLRRAGAALLMLVAGLALTGIFVQRWLVRDLLRMVEFTRLAGSRSVSDAPVSASTAEMHAAMRSVVEMAQRLQDQREQLGLLHDEAHETNVRLQEKRTSLSAALARLEGLSAELINAQEQERKHLARELHDELGQRLTALKLMLHAILPKAQPGSACWQQAEEEVSAIIAQVRAISVSLRPPALDLFTLDVAIRQMTDRLFNGSGIACEFEAAGVPAALPETTKITAYRLVQESLTNIVRHANATRVVVEINGGEHGRELEIIVRDNGRGFDVDAAHAASRSGLCSGLSGMRERVELLGGSLLLQSRPGHGTRIVACLPIRQGMKNEKENIAG
jgi:signal transduction histidine kinase